MVAAAIFGCAIAHTPISAVILEVFQRDSQK